MRSDSAFLVRAAACAMLAMPALCHAQAADPRPALLRQLDGNWTMSGDVRGKPEAYTMVAAPALQGTFTEVRMKDVHVPAQYEAAVFIGIDADGKGVIAHWMDSFGAKYSIPHASGELAGDTIRFSFPYPGATFRNTWRHDPAAGTWQVAIESAQPDGSWKHFARYDLERK